jgi:hypothetical protein
VGPLSPWGERWAADSVSGERLGGIYGEGRGMEKSEVAAEAVEVKMLGFVIRALMVAYFSLC